jgi:hypothetical protein
MENSPLPQPTPLMRPPMEITPPPPGIFVPPYTGTLHVDLTRRQKYNEDIQYSSSSFISKLCQIERAKKVYDRSTLINIINALVMSKIVCYCSSDIMRLLAWMAPITYSLVNLGRNKNNY